MKESWKNPSINVLNHKSILINWEVIIAEELLYFILKTKAIIEKHNIKEIVEVSNTYNSLIVIYNSTINNIYDKKNCLKLLISQIDESSKQDYNTYLIPICYDQKYGLDLSVISQQKDLSVQEIIKHHTSPLYTIYFIGFLPGFLYLGGLDKRLKISRKKQPRLSLKKGL